MGDAMGASRMSVNGSHVFGLDSLEVETNAQFISDNIISQTSGSTHVDGLLAMSRFEMHGGASGGVGRLQGNLVQDGGIVSPGKAPGILHITGN